MTTAQDDWTGRVAVVTGAAGAMGLALVEALLERGTNVAGIDTPEAASKLHELERAGGRPGLMSLGLDVSDSRAVAKAFEQTLATFGRVDYLVNLAAINSQAAGIVDCTDDDWHRVLGVNLAGTFWCCREALRYMLAREEGSIVNISSVNGHKARRQFSTHAYAASKAAVYGLTMSLAAEAGPRGVRVNCIAPGMHASPLQRASGGSRQAAERYERVAVNATPLRRIGQPHDMVGPILFLLGSTSSFMTGQLLFNDGGRTVWYE